MDQRYRSWFFNGASGTPAQQIDLNSVAVQGTLPVTMPMTVTHFMLTIMNDVADAGIVILKYRPTAGSTTGEVSVGTINLTTAHTQGKIVGKSGLKYDCDPGGELVVEVTNATGAGDLALASIWGFERYEQPTNLTDYVETA